MKHKGKYAIGIGFLIVGIYYGYHALSELLTCLLMLAQLSDSLAATLPFIRFHGWLAYWGEIVQMLLVLVSAAMCVRISIRSVSWRYILWCGIIGVSAYLLSALYAVSIQAMNIDLIFTLIKYSAVPILVIGFALFCRKNQEIEHYYSISRLLKK